MVNRSKMVIKEPEAMFGRRAQCR